MEDTADFITNVATASRIAQLDGKDFKQQMEKLKFKKTVVNHADNFKKYGKKE